MQVSSPPNVQPLNPGRAVQTHVEDCIPGVPGIDTLCGKSIAALGPGHSAQIGLLTAAQITCPDCQRKLCGDTAPDASWSNPCLTKIFIKHFSGWFFQMPDQKKPPDFICDPWWWPRGPGRQKRDWGIPCCDRFVLQSLQSPRDSRNPRNYLLVSSNLCNNVPKKPPNGYPYDGFLGSVRALPGCPILVSIRPSAASFQDSFRLGGGAYKLPCDVANRMVPVHFTDVAKFRQRNRQATTDSDMNPTRWRVSVECLADEFDYLLQDGWKQLIVVEMTKQLFKPSAPLYKMGQLRRAWQSNANDQRLDATLDIVELALKNGQYVRHWQTEGEGFKDDMARALARMPPHSAALYPN